VFSCFKTKTALKSTNLVKVKRGKKVKGQLHTVAKTITATWLLVAAAASMGLHVV